MGSLSGDERCSRASCSQVIFPADWQVSQAMFDPSLLCEGQQPCDISVFNSLCLCCCSVACRLPLLIGMVLVVVANLACSCSIIATSISATPTLSIPEYKTFQQLFSLTITSCTSWSDILQGSGYQHAGLQSSMDRSALGCLCRSGNHKDSHKGWEVSFIPIGLRVQLSI